MSELYENERRFRAYLKRYHPDKYSKLMAMETLEDEIPVLSPT